jgi:uncharacterized protein YecE (DUF72 family)
MIRVGIGGWNYTPWRGLFYPKGLAQARELQFASRALTSIEINSTYHRDQKPASFRKWAAETPDDFVFSLKASMFATNRKNLAEGAPSVKRFLESGFTELGSKLGPIVWQFMPTKKFDPEDFAGFLTLLPKEQDGVTFRHALEVRHDSFRTPEFVALAEQHGCAIVVAESDKYPLIADVTADYVYLRLMKSQADLETGYKPAALTQWKKRVQAWSGGGIPDGLPLLAQKPEKQKPRDVFLYFISGAKERNPAAAMALIEKLK